jgi:hypothetical protein
MASLTRARPVGTRGAIAGVGATNYQSTWFIAILVVMTCGVVEIANADILARRGSPNASGYFWAGLVAIVAPGAVRLGARSSRRVEHLLIATSICIALYLVKVLYAPSTFLFADEFIHYQNAHAAISSGQLFNANVLLPETKGYPGLASVTSAVCSLTGLTIFPAGLLVIGCARFVLALAMFLFVENVVRSSRIAGFAVVLYAGNPNFLFFSAAYAYEQLALPLFVVVLFLLSLRRENHSIHTRSAVAAGVLIPAIVVTHHLTSFLLTASLLLLAGLSVRRRSEDSKPFWWLGIFALTLTVLWSLTVARATLPYLHYILGGAIGGAADLVSKGGTGRTLFVSNSGYVAPIAVRALTVASPILLLILCIAGVIGFRRFYRRDPFASVLGLAALGYFVISLLRVVPSAWETGNRASEFLFIGLGLAASFGASMILYRAKRRLLATYSTACLITVVVLGGPAAGWAPSYLLPRPFELSAGGERIDPAGVAIARWTGRELKPGSRFVTDQTNARLLLHYGSGIVSLHPAFAQILIQSSSFPSWERAALRLTNTQFAIVDRRRIAWDNLGGYYFSRMGTQRNSYFPEAMFQKFGRAGASRVLDGGFVVTYDVSPLEQDARRPVEQRGRGQHAPD